MPTYVDEKGVKHFGSQEVTLKITASDDTTATENLKIALLNEEDYETTKNADLVWENYIATKEWKLSNGSGKKKVYLFVKDEAGNQSLYLERTSYTVSFHMNGGNGDFPMQTIMDGETYILPEEMPTRDGYQFIGWCTNAIMGESDTIYMPGDEYMQAGNQTLYAIWLAKQYTISYNANGGTSAPSDQIKKEGELLTLSNEIPTKSGYVFLGWATQSTATKPEYSAGGVFDLNRDTMLYAVWYQGEVAPSIANAPVLGAGMQAIYWSDEDATNEFVSATFKETMYSYTIGDNKTDTKDSRWANAKTEDGSYWVWIPRYAYKITYYTDAAKTVKSTDKTLYGKIDVLFLNGTSNTMYRDVLGNARPLPEGYIVHPAFQKMTAEEESGGKNPLGKWDTELEGIWVAKYEASREDSTDSINWVATTASNGGGKVLTSKAGNTGSTKVRIAIKPSVTSWRSCNISYIYLNCKAMYPELNSHQMKNSERGAIAYLTYSSYGRNGNELAVNQCIELYTGAGVGAGESSVYNTAYNYDSSSFASSYAWNTTNGKLTSSTGNIYGVYDLSGGSWESVAAYVDNADGNLTTNGNDLVSLAETRMKQVYVKGSAADTGADNYSANSTIYGDAVWETSMSATGSNGWCSDNSKFPFTTNPFFITGGRANTGSGAGLFSFEGRNGAGTSGITFRPVLCINR